MKPQLGKGHFQWTTGGWFGAQIGCTLYLVVLGVIMIIRTPALGALVVACGLAPNLLGIALWRQREHMTPYVAQQILLCGIAVATSVAVTCVTLFGIGHPPGERWDALVGVAWMLAIYPALMLLFHALEKAAVRSNATIKD